MLDVDTLTHTHLTGAGSDVARLLSAVLRRRVRVLRLFPAVINHPIGDVNAGGAAHHSPARRSSRTALIGRILSQIIKTIGSIRSIDDQIETLLMLLPHPLCASLAPVTPHPQRPRMNFSSFLADFRLRLDSRDGFVHLCGAFERLFSFDRRQTHPMGPHGLSFCSCSLSHWERAGVLISLPINRLKSAAERAIRHL